MKNVNKNKQTNKNKNVIIITICAVLVVLLIVVFFIINNNNKDKNIDNNDDNNAQVNDNSQNNQDNQDNQDNQNNDKTENTKKEFDDDIIINKMTINGVKLSDITTIDDVLTKLNARGSFVTLCYTDEAENGCRGTADYASEFTTGNFDDKDLVNVIIYFKLADNKSLEFATKYSIYKKQKNDTPYFELASLEKELLKLDNTYIENWTNKNIQNKYSLDYARFTDYGYKYTFNSKDGDKFIFDGTYSSSHWSLRNDSLATRN